MKRLSPTRRLYIKVSELKEQMERLVAHDGTPEAIVKLSRVERRYWPLQAELLRRMDERDALVAREHAPPDIRITAINGWRQNTVMPAKISLKGANE